MDIFDNQLTRSGSVFRHVNEHREWALIAELLYPEVYPPPSSIVTLNPHIIKSSGHLGGFMFSRPSTESPELPLYVPGYIAFPSGDAPSPAAEEARLFHERITLHRDKIKQEQEELERVKAARTAADLAWEKAEKTRRARLEKIKEEALKAELEWQRMGGRIRGTPSDEELRRKLDEEANLTDEERALRRAWEVYDKGWERLAMSIRPVKTFTFRKIAFSFADIPWPVLRQPAAASPLDLQDITGPSVSKFLLHPKRDPGKSRKEKLRDAMLRYHPDKFVGRILPRIVPEERTRVQEGVGIVMKCLNELMSAER